jgi:uracil-DNA glycosylase
MPVDAGAKSVDAAEQLRAWVEYFRDLGVYDLYRQGEPIPGYGLAGIAAQDAEPVSAPPESKTPSVVQPIPPQQLVRPAREQSAPVAGSLPYAPPPPPKPIDRSFLEPPSMPLISFDKLTPLPTELVPAADKAAALLAIQQEIGDCTRCPLAYAGRRKIVFADGSPTARLMFVGEGPGADEDTQGLPFVGKAGQLLNNMVSAMGLTREEVYIANIVKCRPPANRVPEPVEANTCSPFLLRQIDVVRPEVIVALGSTAATYLLGVKQSLSGLRGRWHSCRGAKLAVTYHPAFLLRDPRQKGEAWKDLQMVMAELGLKAPAKK